MSKAVGIDIGTEALRGVVVESHRGKLQLIAAGAVPLGEWAALEDNQDKRLAVGEKLKELVRGAGLRAPKRRIAVTSKGAALRYLNVPPVPPWRLEMLARYEVEERGDNKEPSAFDYRILDVPEMGGQYTVLLGALHERVVNWLMDISRQARLGEVEPDLKALALYNAYYHGHGFDPDKTVLVVDIGATEITVLLVRNGALYLARTFEGGGQRFTQALSEELKATILEAEELKKNEAEILLEQASSGATSMFRRAGRMGASTIRRPPNGPNAREMPLVKPGEGAPKSGAGPVEGAADLPGEAPYGGVERKVPAADAPSVPAPPPADSTVPAAGSDRGGPARASSSAPSAPAVPSETATPSVPAPADGDAPAPGYGGLKDIELELSPSGTQLVPASATDKPRRPLSAGDQAFLDELDDLQPAVKRRKQISQLLVRESAALCAALESALNYCRGQYKMRDLKIDTVYLTGAGSRLKGLSQLIGRRMRAPVEPLDVFRQLDLGRLPEEAAATLRAEQDRMAVSVGLALSGLCSGAFNFLLWPTALKERKEFWARGAFLYYAAAALLAVLAILFFTPHRNAETLAQNEALMTTAIQEAKLLEQQLVFAEQEHEELQRRLEQIDLNAKSGAFFLKVLAELKDTQRIPQDVWLTSLSTNLPSVILKDAYPDREPGERAPGERTPGSVPEPGAKASAPVAVTPDTFQAQARVYLRGFVRSGQKSDLYNKIMGDRTSKPFVPGFCDLLVPVPDDPEHPRNLFRDIRPVWVEREDHDDGPRFLKEFVLEAYVEGSREVGRKAPAPKATGRAADAEPKVSGPEAVEKAPAAETPAKVPVPGEPPATPPGKAAGPERKAVDPVKKAAVPAAQAPGGAGQALAPAQPGPKAPAEAAKPAPDPAPAKKPPAVKVPADPEAKAF